MGSAVGSIRDLFAKIKSIDDKHGKFDLVLCLGDFFGPPKDAADAYEEDHEVMQLLNGRLEGRVTSLSLVCISCSMYRHYSPSRMLHHARRVPAPGPCH